MTEAGKRMPYPVATNMEELIQNIKNYDVDLEFKKNKRHMELMGTYDRGVALEKIGNLVEMICR